MEGGGVADVATIFLTNRECPWKCVMCDLWRNTAPAQPGSIPKQIAQALEKFRGERPSAKPTVLKLYNSGSFFDVGAIQKSDWKAIANLCQQFELVVVECHPKLVTEAVMEFAEMIGGRLEVAMGLETVHPEALEKINKRIVVEDFRRAAAFLSANEISVRTFLLVGVPFIPAMEQAKWLKRSLEFAFASGAGVVSLIPTRAGNGAIDQLQAMGVFQTPLLEDLEEAQEYGLRMNAGRVFGDTWEAERFCGCARCAQDRVRRIARMNLSQEIEGRVECDCGS
jgi:radical SAM enzyme (TIGR01210 family)